MKEDIIEYHFNGSIKHRMSYYDNGGIKHRIVYYSNGNKWGEQYYDLQGKNHREQVLPDFYSCYTNGFIKNKTYCVHDKRHNIHNPSVISFFENGRIVYKSYWLNDYKYSKLIWMTLIKNI